MNAATPRAEPLVPSPCTGVCRIGERGHCIGCGRVIDEIVAWSRTTHDRQLDIRAQAAARLDADKDDSTSR